MASPQFDVAAIEIANSNVLWVSGPHDAENAQAVINMAIMRQGVEDRFFSPCQHEQYKAGDKWTGGVPLPELDNEYVHSGGMAFPRGKRGL
jgi:hypothetical protein